MKLRIYQIDAFTDKVFSGNPAAVCPLETWLSDDLLQAADDLVTIPMATPVESLNVAVAAAILVYAARRQRL